MNILKNMELMKKTYDNLLNEVAKKYNLTLNELKTLTFLKNCNGNNIAKYIAAGVGSTKSHISLSVNNLEKNGYIVKIQDANDKKQIHLELTEKSIEVVKNAKEVQDKMRVMLVEGLTEEELNVLKKACMKINENLEKYSTN